MICHKKRHEQETEKEKHIKLDRESEKEIEKGA